MKKYHLVVKPNARTSSVSVNSDGQLVVAVRAPATEGRANEELIAVLAAYFQVPKSRIQLIKGHTSRYKVVELLD
ncbi:MULTISPECIES: DUF167 domain-containing protein [unclassified Thermosynechococcus]|uniref:DUF167 domain-containing protein n=1 Tax=unclassified Thermosynechococcus TaxID=2622553 RepID=UPI001980D65A|nr:MULTISPECIES: DUF167 domain-containing protein [unclassified Thermosynechococcus]MDR5639353.1 DUF167 domain-containing protein [Thermosynechococcus sp. PP42]MDR7922140.1 DUF167 domain-containing protein [Thermosynechococcus sp. HY213]QSF48099.1 DUF167 domain-containing protein [Thermosynechococcus sp. TA-1]WKT80032.1 DUF167 domain-containing protein [Thermosynechococcus sp. PP45]WNC21114.1 DUF167 domain-containing protein [Thermosynechococcus sp. PP22]